jgi:hypothetical protein
VVVALATCGDGDAPPPAHRSHGWDPPVVWERTPEGAWGVVAPPCAWGGCGSSGRALVVVRDAGAAD